MEEATTAAVAALRRAEEAVAAGPRPDEPRVDLTAVRRDVEALARHTRVLVAGTANRWRIADELNGHNVRQAQADFCTRQREVFARFGLNPLARPVEEAARTVSTSRIRDALLGMLFEWRQYAAEPGMKDRLGQVVGATRRLSGGAHARWQDLLDRVDVTGLVAFSRSPDAMTFSASVVNELARDLNAAGELPACLAYLRAATDRYPQDAWLHYEYYVRGRYEPEQYFEALRHIAAACVLRPDSALFHLRLGNCYYSLAAYDSAVEACLKSIALNPKSSFAYMCMGNALAKKKDEKGAIAALNEALRLWPNDPRPIRAFARGQYDLGRPVEAYRVLVDALERSPSWADDPQLFLRYDVACNALRFAHGEGSPPASVAQRQMYRKQALDLIAADLTALAKLADSDRAFVRQTLRHWLRDPDLEGVRPPKTADLPADERRGWEELWARVQALTDSTRSKARSGSR
jgi:tetratricopeptide (TPR) repeat protein